ncbi:hypothetical protein EX895_005537 [Sporisorium graminicola]|uniref:Rab-GAP TBC domain-containing protein n=1 Tax=Sporisorium graminicola TaxID=280036 RepID=A0A4U7KM17_9BASI|nr:hypothetical protein EX895_005537 [Sporisorium graminicola]TKY85375.1 hypothetical protein EX895_005537 [Sporisorium graminicola]
MASSHDSAAPPDVTPPVDEANDAARASQEASHVSDHTEQADLDTEDRQDAEVIALSGSAEATLTADKPPPEIATQSDQSTRIELESEQEELQLASDASEDDGDISLVTSPKVDQNASAGATPSAFHRRIDSVPPQKYNVSSDPANGLSNAFASTSLQASLEEEDEADISIQQHEHDADIDFGPRSSPAYRSFGHVDELESHPGPTTIDKADLKFVDIALDAPEQDASIGANMLEPTNPLAGSARTAEQIRRDSVCSQSVQPSATTADAEQDAVLAASAYLSKHGASPPLSPDHGDASGCRSVEGRYRGRRSVATSRAASPAPSPSPSPRTSRRASMTLSQEPIHHSPSSSATPESRPPAPDAPAPTLLASDEHGNICIVSEIPVSPRTVPEGGRPLPSEPQQPNSGITSSDNASAHKTAAPAELRAIQSTNKVATSLSDEVSAADAVEGPQALEAVLRDTITASPIAPANGDSSYHSTTLNPGLSDKADQVDSKTRRKSSSASAGPVESRTRMTTLPAKPKTEEIKHRADFERMMMAAKDAERKRREEEEERKRRRQDEQREALARWDKEILPSWSRARKDPELEQLWWQGAPPSIRGRVWALAIGNPLMLPRNLLEQSEKKAAGSSNQPIEAAIPPRVLDQIDQDVEDTLPSLKLFQTSGPLHEDLVRLCRAFVLVRMEQVSELDVAGDANRNASRHQHASPLSPKSPLLTDEDDNYEPDEQEADPQDEYLRRGIDIYQPGLASLAAVLLINMSINTAFIALLNLLHSKPWLKALYSLLPSIVPPASGTSPASVQRARFASSATRKNPGSAYTLPPKDKAIRGFERVFETLLADQMPKVYANLLAHNVKLYRVVLRDWVTTLWTGWLDVDTVMRLWDVVLLDETDSMIYRACLALVQMLESRLYVPDQGELESVLKGTNRAALAIWRRDKQMRGELEVHAHHALNAPRHSRSSISSSAPEPRGTYTSSTTSPSTQSEGSTLAVQSDTTEPDPDAILPRDYIYEQYAIQEQHVFSTLEAQKSWWKQSTLQRLLDRELSE